MIEIPGKEIRFEDGTKVKVPPFRIERTCVSLQQFENFCAITGYQTTAERSGDSETYCQNDRLALLNDRERGAVAVGGLSFEDATAFCQCNGVRLPTEAEWLAASVLDWEKIVESEIYHREVRKVASRSQALRFNLKEWVIANQNDIVVPALRIGPKYLLEADWAMKPNVLHRDRTYYDILTGFRVCAKQ